MQGGGCYNLFLKFAVSFLVLKFIFKLKNDSIVIVKATKTYL